MTRDYQSLNGATGKPSANAVPDGSLAHQQNDCRVNTFLNGHRRLSLLSQRSLPRGHEYRPNRRLPPNGLESRQRMIRTNRARAPEKKSASAAVEPATKPKSSPNLSWTFLCCGIANEKADES